MSEGARHLYIRGQIILALVHHTEVTDLKPERQFDTVQADINFCLRHMQVAIEIQQSNVSWMNVVHPMGWSVILRNASLLK